MTLNILENQPLAGYTTFGLGGLAHFFTAVGSVRELDEVNRWAKDRNLPIAVLGGGANTLVTDRGYEGLVVKMDIPGVEYRKGEEGLELVVGAGEDWDELVAQVVDLGYFGLENLSGIPGSVGAAPVQNIGAYGVELGQFLRYVKIYDLVTGEERELAGDDCRLGYRTSIFKTPAGRGWIITAVGLGLSLKAGPVTGYREVAERTITRDVGSLTATEMRELVLAIRRDKVPDHRSIGTAGSFFTNPVIDRQSADRLRQVYPELPAYPEPDGERLKVSAAYLLDKVCGLKGVRRGQVALYEKQPLVLVAYPGATAAEVSSLAEYVQSRVRAKTGIELQREVVTLGDD